MRNDRPMRRTLTSAARRAPSTRRGTGSCGRPAERLAGLQRMIRHVVIFTWSAAADERRRATSVQALRRLRQDVGGMQSLVVAEDAGLVGRQRRRRADRGLRRRRGVLPVRAGPRAPGGRRRARAPVARRPQRPPIPDLSSPRPAGRPAVHRSRRAGRSPARPAARVGAWLPVATVPLRPRALRRAALRSRGDRRLAARPARLPAPGVGGPDQPHRQRRQPGRADGARRSPARRRRGRGRGRAHAERAHRPAGRGAAGGGLRGARRPRGDAGAGAGTAARPGCRTAGWSTRWWSPWRGTASPCARRSSCAPAAGGPTTARARAARRGPGRRCRRG